MSDGSVSPWRKILPNPPRQLTGGPDGTHAYEARRATLHRPNGGETMTKSRALVLIGVLTALASCATVKELEVRAPLAPMPQPQLQPGYAEVTLYNGKEMTSTLVAEDATTRNWKRSDGCSATTPKSGFGPAYKWENCNGSTGTVTSRLEGEIWPLAVGKTWSYTYSGSNARGATWSGTRSCAVRATARIVTPSGEEDTFKVACRDHDSTYTYYVSPARRATVRYEQYRQDGWRVTSELIRAK